MEHKVTVLLPHACGSTLLPTPGYNGGMSAQTCRAQLLDAPLSHNFPPDRALHASTSGQQQNLRDEGTLSAERVHQLRTYVGPMLTQHTTANPGACLAQEGITTAPFHTLLLHSVLHSPTHKYAALPSEHC